MSHRSDRILWITAEATVPPPPAVRSLVGAVARGGSIVSRRPVSKRTPTIGRWKEYGSECYWAGLVGAVLAMILVACAVGSESHGPERSASEVVRQSAR
jgi:hypothetical protein